MEISLIRFPRSKSVGGNILGRSTIIYHWIEPEHGTNASLLGAVLPKRVHFSVKLFLFESNRWICYIVFFSKWIHWCCGHRVTQVLYTWLLFSIFCDLVHIVLPVSPWVISLAGCKNDVKRYWKRCSFLNAEWTVDVFIHTYGDSKIIRLGWLGACAPSCYW